MKNAKITYLIAQHLYLIVKKTRIKKSFISLRFLVIIMWLSNDQCCKNNKFMNFYEKCQNHIHYTLTSIFHREKS